MEFICHGWTLITLISFVMVGIFKVGCEKLTSRGLKDNCTKFLFRFHFICRSSHGNNNYLTASSFCFSCSWSGGDFLEITKSWKKALSWSSTLIDLIFDRNLVITVDECQISFFLFWHCSPLLFKLSTGNDVSWPRISSIFSFFPFL